MTDDREAGGKAPADPQFVEITGADGKVIFRAALNPPRFRQLDAEAQARIVSEVRLHLAVPETVAAAAWRNVFMAMFPLAHAIEPRPDTFKKSDWLRMTKLAAELKNLCARHVREQPETAEQDPCFDLIGRLDHLENWSKRQSAMSGRARGQPRPNWLDGALEDFRLSFAHLFGVEPTDAPKAPFNRFVQATLRELSGIEIGNDWLRDKRRKQGGK
ncbi:hypothetical protein [Acidiphilium cryptum]|uniref:Uncharacterized protein n=1 Tax=Acidiphilium cryptum (strain JF-5) TaxID=349163 RepID=A5G0W9_ACICJ|nr:hypothetical protein [Acidiphilium cryptum]ABQ31501.1 hypothetical protein Acry_2306 [Acidiphilium cryptum JF-5]